MATPEQLAQQALAPALAEIQRQQAEEKRRALQQQGTVQGAAGGLAHVLGQIAPQTEQTYQAAGDRTAAYAKGFSAAAAGDSNAAAASLNDILARTGAPGAAPVKAAGNNMGDVLFGLGGYIPASSLAREGAAFTAAAQQLPGTARLQGDAQAAAVGMDSRDKLAQLNALLRQEKGKLPGLTREIRSDMDELKVKQRAQQLNEAIAVEELGIKKGQLGVSQENAATSRINAQTSRLNAKIRQQQNQFNQLLGKAKLELDVDKYELAMDKESRLKKSPKKGGFTAKQKQDLAGIAFDTAADDYDSGTRPVETLRDLIAAGVPFSIAIKAIQRFGRDKAADAYWKATLGWTRKK